MRNLRWVAINVTAIIWGTIYFFIGAAFSFTLGSIGFWNGATVYLALFLLPLPISVAAIRFPNAAGIALICCAATSISVAVAYGLSTDAPSSFLGFCKFLGWHVPHILFAVFYMRQAKSNDYVGRSPASV